MKRLIKLMFAFALIVFTGLWYDSMSGGPGGTCCSISAPGMKLFARDATSAVKVPALEQDRPADASPVLYQVMGVIVVIWFGLALFLYRIDRRVTRLEKTLPDKPENDS
jgi:hypothetical protein